MRHGFRRELRATRKPSVSHQTPGMSSKRMAMRQWKAVSCQLPLRLPRSLSRICCSLLLRVTQLVISLTNHCTHFFIEAAVHAGEACHDLLRPLEILKLALGRPISGRVR